MNSEFGILNSEFPFASAWNAEGGWVKIRNPKSEIRNAIGR
jgi:hypothetical protein